MHNIDTERIILSCCIMSPTSLPELLSKITTDDFYIDKHRIIFDSLKDLFSNGKELKIANLMSYYTDKDLDVKKETLEILDFWTGGNIDQEITSLLDYSQRRKLSKQLNYAGEMLQKKEYSLDKISFDIDNTLKAIASNQITALTSMKDMATGDIKDLSEHKRFFRTGINKLDESLWGIFCGELIILAARPKCGKTSLAGNIGTYIAERYHNDNVLMFSLEMRKEQLRRRFISQYAEVDSFLIKTGKLTEDQKIIVENAMIRVDDLHMYISDNIFELEQLINTARRFASIRNVSCIIVDYIQLINYAIKGATREHVISEIARNLKLLAGELEVPVIALSQLSRAVELRPDQHPILSDLRESGALEQHADGVWFIFQDKIEKEKGTIQENQFELEVAAYRDGKAGFSIELLFDKKFTKFSEF